METRERVTSPLRPAAAVAEPSTAEPPAGTPAPPAAPPGDTARRLPLRELTGWEEEYLEHHQSDANTARLCNEVLARCLVAPGADSGDARESVRGLLVAERDRELIALRRMSIGPGVHARVDCPGCERENEVEFDLDSLPVDFASPEQRLATEILGLGEVVLRLPTAGDQEDLLDEGDLDDAERRTWLLARCVERYGERDGGFDLDFARSIPTRVRRFLEAVIEESLPRLGLEMAVECSHCGAGFTAPFDVHVFFFRASRASGRAVARRAPHRARLPLGRAGHHRPHARPADRLPPAPGGGGGRVARRRAGRLALTPLHGREA
jgi:hypothetical protein